MSATGRNRGIRPRIAASISALTAWCAGAALPGEVRGNATLANAAVLAAQGADASPAASSKSGGSGGLDLRSISVAEGSVIVRIAWPAGLGRATVTRMAGGSSVSVPVAGSTHFDAPSGTGPITYRVAAGKRRFEGSTTPLAAPDCAFGQAGGGSGPPGDGPPECGWKMNFPGTTPFGICFRSQPVPAIRADAEFSWNDVATRAGYLVEFGEADMACSSAPPFTFSGRSVAITDRRALRFGQNPVLGGILGGARLPELLARANLALTRWPKPAAGKIYGWRVRPVEASADGRHFAVGRPHLLPRVYQVLP